MFDKCFLKHIYDIYKMTLKILFHLFFPAHLYDFFHFSPLDRKIFWKLSWPPLPLYDSFWTLSGLCLIGDIYSSWISRTVSVSSLHCACRDFTLLAVFLSDFEKQNSHVVLFFFFFVFPFLFYNMTAYFL